MKSLLVPAVIGAAVAASLMLSPAARAQIPVTDGIAEVSLSVANAQWITQLADMASQYTQIVLTLNAIAHPTALNGISGVLGGINRAYMPASGSIPGLMTGQGGSYGMAPQFMAQGQYYRSPNNDPWQQEMTRRQQVTANAQAIAQATETDAETSIQNLSAMQARIEQGADGTEDTAVNGYIALEHQRLDANRAQMQGIQAMLAADDRVSEQRAEQINRKNADDMTAATAPLTAPFQ